jgi:hypothetical protein
MARPMLHLDLQTKAGFYSLIGRVSLLLVEENVDAITATNFLREIAEAGGSMLDTEHAIQIAQNYVDIRHPEPQGG